MMKKTFVNNFLVTLFHIQVLWHETNVHLFYCYSIGDHNFFKIQKMSNETKFIYLKMTRWPADHPIVKLVDKYGLKPHPYQEDILDFVGSLRGKPSVHYNYATGSVVVIPMQRCFNRVAYVLYLGDELKDN